MDVLAIFEPLLLLFGGNLVDLATDDPVGTAFEDDEDGDTLLGDEVLSPMIIPQSLLAL